VNEHHTKVVSQLKLRPYTTQMKRQQTKVHLSHPNAVLPTKTNPTDSGFDLWIIEKVKDINSDTVLYDTGVVLVPPPGIYYDVIGRSSISKTGWMVSNNVGVIDNGYRGTIKVALTKVSQDAVELSLPLRIVQLIPRQVLNMQMKRVSSLEDSDKTARGTDGGINR